MAQLYWFELTAWETPVNTMLHEQTVKMNTKSSIGINAIIGILLALFFIQLSFGWPVFFSERELTLTFAIYMLSPVRLSVTFVHPTQPVKIFSNVSSPFSTVAIHWHSLKILRRSSQRNPPSGGLTQEGSQIVIFFDISKAIPRKRCKIAGKLVLITDRKSYVSFRLLPKSVTLNDRERRNGPYFALFYRIW